MLFKNDATNIVIYVLAGRTCYTSNKLDNSDNCAAAEVELCRERYAVHFLFGFVLEGDFLVGDDSAGEELAFDVYPRVFRHQKLMQIPGEPFFIEWVGLEVPSFPVVLLASDGARE